MTQDTPTVEDIANKIGYFCVEEIVNEYFSTAPHYRGRRALKILLQEKVGTILTTNRQQAFEEGVKAERERVSDCANTLRKTKKFPQQLIRHDRTVEYFERLSDSDIHYNEALDHLLEFLSDNK